MDTVISLRKISLSYGGPDTLRDITLDIRRGEFVFILGNSGKSSLLKLMGGIEHPSKGNILYGEENPYTGTDRRRCEILKQTGHLFQDAALLANISMFDNVALPLRYHTKLSEDEIQTRVFKMFARFDLRLQTDLRPAVFQLGMRKMVALARALILEPDKLFLDDLCSGLDLRARDKMANALLDIKRSNTVTAILITEDMEILSLLADRVLVLHDGSLIADDTKDAIFNSEDPRVEAILSLLGHETSSKNSKAEKGSASGEAI